MRRQKAGFLLAALVGVTLAAAVAAHAADARGGRVPARHSMESRLQKRLGLTDEQTTAIREIRQRQAQSGKQLREQLRQARVELNGLALQGGDEAAIASKAAEVKDLLAQMVEMRVTTLRQIGPILTPEQREKLATPDHGRRARHHRERS